MIQKKWLILALVIGFIGGASTIIGIDQRFFHELAARRHAEQAFSKKYQKTDSSAVLFLDSAYKYYVDVRK